MHLADLREKLKRLGHRNWVVVADAAFPVQVPRGIDVHTLEQATGVVEVASEVMKVVRTLGHVRVVPVIAKEINFVTDADAPGAASIRSKIDELLKHHEQEVLNHAEILTRLAEVSEQYTILVVKTATKIPYTSILFRLECGYWSDAAEQRLRHAMENPR